MLYREFRPRGRLANWVRLIWTLELSCPGSFGPAERIVPDGIVEAVFHYGAPFAMRFAGGTFDCQPRSFVLSQTRRFVEIRPRGASGFVSVRFHPWGACRFFRQPLSEFADRMVPSEELWGAEVRELEDRLVDAVDAEERVRRVERFLWQRLDDDRAMDVEPLVRAIWERRGRVRVPSLAEGFGIGQRRLQRLFAADLGMSPKAYARLSRFLFACRRMRQGGWNRLTDVALACGYYDQAHFNGDFKAYSGMTPGEFARGSNLSFLEIG